MFRPPTKYSEYLQDVRKSIDYILKRVNATTVTKIVAGTSITISPADGTGTVTINATVGPTPTLAQVTTAGNTTANSIVIGSSSAITASPYTLQVVGGAGGSAIFSNSAKTQGLNINLTTAGETRIYGDYFGAGVDQKLILGTFANRATQVVLQTSGNISIGTTTDAGYKLDVNGTIRSSGAIRTDATGYAISLPGLAANSGIFINSTNAYLVYNTDSQITWGGNGVTIASGPGRIKLSNYSNNGVVIYNQAGSGAAYYALTVNNTTTIATTGYQVGVLAGSLPPIIELYTASSSLIYGFNTTDFRSSMPVIIGSQSAPIGKLQVTGSITAASLLAQGVYFNNTLVAAANNDVLVGLDINPTFTNGAFTGVTNIDLRTKGTGLVIGSGVGYGAVWGYNNDGIVQVKTNGSSTEMWFRPNGSPGAINSSYWSNIKQESYNFKLIPGNYQTGYFRNLSTSGGIYLGGSEAFNSFGIYIPNAGGTSNVLIGTTTDAGYKLDVAGTFRYTGGGFFQGGTNTPVSIGTYMMTYVSSTTSYIHAYSNTSYAPLAFRASTLSFYSGQGSYSQWGLDNTGMSLYDAVSGVVNHQWARDGVTRSSGTTPYAAYTISPVINNTGTYSGIVRGIYYNPTLTSLTGTTHRAIETTSGDVIFNGGNVGVGTSSPSYPFHISSAAAANIYGTVQSTNANGTAAWVAFNDQSDNVVYRVFGSGASGTQMGIALARSASLIANLGGAGSFLLGTYSATNFIMGTGNAEKMRIVDSTGNILIATTTDLGNKLEVNGNINSTGYKINNTAGYTGTLVIVTNPPGQQNIDIRGGIVVNIF